MISKTFEVRDAGTFIPMLATKLRPACEADRYLIARAGFGSAPLEQEGYILLSRINGGGGEGHSSYYDWPNRTMKEAHKYIEEHFDELDSGAVIDVEFILGEKHTKKITEAAEA